MNILLVFPSPKKLLFHDIDDYKYSNVCMHTMTFNHIRMRKKSFFEMRISINRVYIFDITIMILVYLYSKKEGLISIYVYRIET